MARVDYESKAYMAIDVMHDELRRYRKLELRVEIPPALFKCGQSVLQWWASWMKEAKETPASYNKKTRPAWFSAEITRFRGYCDIKYAGQMMRRSALRVLPHVAALFSLRLRELMQHCELMHPSASSCSLRPSARRPRPRVRANTS